METGRTAHDLKASQLETPPGQGFAECLLTITLCASTS
jgi:hypothetical protein